MLQWYKTESKIAEGDTFVPQTSSGPLKSNWIIRDLDVDSLLKELRQKALPSSSDFEVMYKGEGMGQ